jgi:hypothetical protein
MKLNSQLDQTLCNSLRIDFDTRLQRVLESGGISHKLHSHIYNKIELMETGVQDVYRQLILHIKTHQIS